MWRLWNSFHLSEIDKIKNSCLDFIYFFSDERL